MTTSFIKSKEPIMRRSSQREHVKLKPRSR